MARGPTVRRQIKHGWITFIPVTCCNRFHESCRVVLRRKFFRVRLKRGYKYWRERFFLADGWPKYYDDALYPADTHSAAAAIVTLLELQHLDSEALPLAEKIAAWLLTHMRDKRGFFYYQRKRFYTVRAPFMRWSQAWTAYALARLLEEK